MAIHPYLFAIFPVLFLFSHNAGQISFSEILLPSTVVLGSTFLLLYLAGFILKNDKKAAIIASVFLILFFSYGHVFYVMSGWHVGNFLIAMHKYLMTIMGILFICGIYLTIKTKRNLNDLTNVINIIALSLVIISFMHIGLFKFKTVLVRPNVKNPIAIDALRSVKPDKLPDIYYIIMDQYASNTTLREIYNFDNSEFTDYLSKRGFYVAYESKSNYSKTDHSLASSLNMEYINYLSESVGEESHDWGPIAEMMQDYKVWRFLKRQGYRFIHFGTWYPPTVKNRYADTNFNLYPLLSEFTTTLYKTTMLHPISSLVGILDPHRMQWKKIQYNFDRLAEIPKMKEPTFVFAHMLIPHPPYIFDRDGSFRAPGKTRRILNREKYLDQLIFTNKKLKTLIDELLANSEVPPIIVLQADEGPYPARFSHDMYHFDLKFDNLERATRAELREKMGILNAYYLPNVNGDVLYASITPVNSFRVIFNLYFNTNFDLLRDENYALVDLARPYKLVNVTDRIGN